MRKITILFAAAAIWSGVTVTAASAMPIAPVPTDPAAKIEQVRWVCGPYGRCCAAELLPWLLWLRVLPATPLLAPSILVVMDGAEQTTPPLSLFLTQ